MDREGRLQKLRGIFTGNKQTSDIQSQALEEEEQETTPPTAEEEALAALKDQLSEQFESFFIRDGIQSIEYLEPFVVDWKTVMEGSVATLPTEFQSMQLHSLSLQHEENKQSIMLNFSTYDDFYEYPNSQLGLTLTNNQCNLNLSYIGSLNEIITETQSDSRPIPQIINAKRMEEALGFASQEIQARKEKQNR